MRRLVPALLFVPLALVGLVSLAAFAPPRPKRPNFTVTVRNAGTTVRIKWTIAVTPSDSLTVDASATGQPSVHRKYTADTKTDSLDYPKPVPGASISGSVLGTNWRGSRSASAPAVPWTYVEPDTVVTPPSVTVDVVPTSATVPQGGTVQFTATVS